MNSHARILVAGIGNIFFGDDGFGSEVARQLASRPQRYGVRVIDFGIRGIDLAFALQDGYDSAILIDAMARGGSPGTLYLIEPDLTVTATPGLEPHSLDPARVIGMIHSSGEKLPILRLVGCEPESLGSDEDPRMELSASVRDAVDRAISMVEDLVDQFLRSPADA